MRRHFAMENEEVVLSPEEQAAVQAETAERAELSEISLEEEALMSEEAGNAMAASGADLAEVDRITEVSDALEDLAVVADGIEAATPSEIALIEATGQMAVAGTDVAPEEVVPAMEAFAGGKIDTAQIKATAKRIWESMQKFLKSVWEKIEKFFYSALGTIPALERRLKDLEKKAASASGANTAGASPVSVKAGGAALAINGKPVTNEVELAKGLVELNSAAKYIFGPYMDTLNKRGHAIAQAIGAFKPEENVQAAADLRTTLAANQFAEIPGASPDNKGGADLFETKKGPALLGNLHLASRQYVDSGSNGVNDAGVSVLGALDRYRRTEVTVVRFDGAGDSKVSFKPISSGGAKAIIKDALELLKTIEEYKRGAHGQKAIDKTRKEIESASSKATASFNSAADSKGGVEAYRASLNFNAAYAKWSREPAVPFISSALSTVRATIAVLQKTLGVTAGKDGGQAALAA